MKGQLIAIEGIDEYAKLALARELFQEYRNKGFYVYYTSGLSIITSNVSESSINQEVSRTQKRYSNLVETIEKKDKPALILNGYRLQTAAHALFNGIEINWNEAYRNKEQKSTNEKPKQLLIPDITFYLRTNPAILLKNMKKTNKSDLTKNISLSDLEKLADCYEQALKIFPTLKIRILEKKNSLELKSNLILDIFNCYNERTPSLV